MADYWSMRYIALLFLTLTFLFADESPSTGAAADGAADAGASVKIPAWPDGKPPAASRAKCQFTTYKRMCDDRHPWGCYMTAKEYLRTDGYRSKSKRQHDAYMRRACAISATSGACRDRFK